jgi:hypothetical protein
MCIAALRYLIYCIPLLITIDRCVMQPIGSDASKLVSSSINTKDLLIGACVFCKF